MKHVTRSHFFLVLLAGWLGLAQSAAAQTGPGWGRTGVGGRVATGGTDYVYSLGAGAINGFTSQGRLRWARPLAGGAVEAMTADAAGNLWLTGSSSTGLTIGGLTLPAGGFVIRCDSQGNVVWGRAIGIVQGLTPAGQGIACGPGGDVCVAAVGGPLPNVPGPNTFLLKYDAAGTLQWTQLAAGAEARAVTVDASGNTWLAGSFQTAASFGGSQLARAGRNGFLARYSAQGQLQWTKIFAAPGRYAYRVSSYIPNVKGLKADGNAAYLTCTVGDTVDFGQARVVAGFSTHTVLLRYDAQGNQQWLRRVVGSNVLVSGLGVDASGNAVVGGSFLGDLRAEQFSTALSLGSDLFVAQYSPQGAAQWLRHERQPADQLMQDVACDAVGHAYGTGYLFGSGTTALGDTTLPAGGAFLVRFGANVLASKAPAAFDPLQLYPNPSRAGQLAQLTWAAPAAPGTTLTLRNLLGQALRTQPVAPGSRAATVATAGLTPGCYLVQLRTPAGAATCRLVVE